VKCFLATSSLVALAACGAPEPGPYNLIVISIDTLRADRLGCYGYERETSPEIDAFAERCVLFEHAIAESSWTVPSHTTLLTGLRPESHGVATPEARPRQETKFLAQYLAAEDYLCFAVTDGGWMEPDRFGAGFRDFDFADRGLRANLEQARSFIEFLDGVQPYFAFVHTYDVHCPYDPIEPHATAFASAGAEFIETAGRCGNPDYNEAGVTPAQALHISDRYDGGIRQASAELGTFFQFLDESGALDDTIVVLTSDHGEEFLEHGQIGHERSLHRELLEVPLLLHVPGLEPRRVSSGTAGLADLVPTLLELLGLPQPSPLDGTSLAPLLRGERQELPPFRASELHWLAELRAWTSADEQLVWNPDSGESWVEADESDVEALRQDLLETLEGRGGR